MRNKELNGRHRQLLHTQQWLQIENDRNIKLNKQQSSMFSKLQNLVTLETKKFTEYGEYHVQGK